MKLLIFSKCWLTMRNLWLEIFVATDLDRNRNGPNRDVTFSRLPEEMLLFLMETPVGVAHPLIAPINQSDFSYRHRL